MPVGIFASKGTGTSGSTDGRPWDDDGSVPVDLYVNNLTGSDSFDGSSPTVGAGSVGPFLTIKRAIEATPLAAETARTIHIAGTGTKYTVDSCVLKCMNKLTFQGDTSVESSETISSINSSARSVGLDLTIGGALAADVHRGKLVDFTSGGMASRFGWIYSNDATDIQVSQDTPGSSSFAVPAASDTLDILSLDTEVEILGSVVMTSSAGGCSWNNIRFTGAGGIVIVSTDQITFQYCSIETEHLQLGGFGRALLLCTYLATTGNSQHGLLGVLNQAHLFVNRGTVIDGGLNAGANNHSRSASQASWETDSEVVFKEVGEVRWRGTQVMTRNAVAAGEHTWRFVDCDGIVGNDDGESSWGHWDLPVCFGNVTGTYFLTGTRGVWGRIASGSSVTTTSTTNAVSADDGATAVADDPDYTYFEGGDPAGIGNAQGPSSIEGVSNYGGNIDLVPTDAIVITGNDVTDEIVIGESHSTLTTNPHNTKQIMNFVLSLDARVPAGGQRYLKFDGVFTSAAEILVKKAGTLRLGSVVVDIADATRDYDFELLVNGIVEETFTLPSGSTEASDVGFTTAVAVDDKIAVRATRSSGSGRSTFRNLNYYFDMLET